MKNNIAKITTVVIIAIAIVAAIATILRNEKVQNISKIIYGERDTYRLHHQPVYGEYYTIESLSVANDKTFIIGRKMESSLSQNKDGDTIIKIEPQSSAREIEVPTKKVIGLKSKAIYFTVVIVDNVETLIYFSNDNEVIKHLINTRKSSGA